MAVTVSTRTDNRNTDVYRGEGERFTAADILAIAAEIRRRKTPRDALVFQGGKASMTIQHTVSESL